MWGGSDWVKFQYKDSVERPRLHFFTDITLITQKNIYNQLQLLHFKSKMLIDRFFPKQCINCHKSWEYLCQDCKKMLKPHMEICPYCHKFSQDYKTCFDCKSDLPADRQGSKNNFLEWIIIPFSYTTLLKKLILKLKYYHKKDVVWFLIDRLAFAIECNSQLTTKSYKLITFVPSHWWRKYFVKWYNQSELLAKLLAEKLWWTLVQTMKKTKHTKSQASLNRNQRLNNLNNVFSLQKNEIIKWDETLIIVDDITTTWSTINEMAKIIKKTYPSMKIWWAVLGRHT